MIRSEGSLLSKDRIRHLARDERHSGITKWPREIFANNEACSESLKGYLKQKFRYCSKVRGKIRALAYFEMQLKLLRSLTTTQGNSWCKVTPRRREPTCDGTPVLQHNAIGPPISFYLFYFCTICFLSMRPLIKLGQQSDIINTHGKFTDCINPRGFVLRNLSLAPNREIFPTEFQMLS